MKVNFNLPVLEIDGTPAKVRSGLDEVATAMANAGVPGGSMDILIGAVAKVRREDKSKEDTVTIKRIVLNSLQAPDKEAEGSEMIDRIALALRIHGSEAEVEVSEGQAEKIRKLVHKFNPSPLVYYRLDELLKTASTKKLEAA